MSGDILEFIVDSKIVEDIIAQFLSCFDDDLDALSWRNPWHFYESAQDHNLVLYHLQKREMLQTCF